MRTTPCVGSVGFIVKLTTVGAPGARKPLGGGGGSAKHDSLNQQALELAFESFALPVVQIPLIIYSRPTSFAWISSNNQCTKTYMPNMQLHCIVYEVFQVSNHRYIGIGSEDYYFFGDVATLMARCTNSLWQFDMSIDQKEEVACN